MHSISAEQSLIGAILLNNQLYGPAVERVNVNDYFEYIHQQIWNICADLIGHGKKATPLSVTAFLPADMKIGELTLAQYVARLAAAGAVANEVPQLAELVRDLADKRRLREAFVNGIEALESPGSNLEVIGSATVESLDELLSARTYADSPSLTLRASVVRAVDAAAKAYQNSGAVSGLSYGLRELDAKTGGLHKGELTLLAGRPGMMKTGVALNFARSLCTEEISSHGEVIKPAYSGIFFSLEMGDILLSQRLLSDMILGFERNREVPYSRIRKGSISEIEFGYIASAATRLAELPLQIEQQGGMNLAQVGAKARRQKRKGLDFIVVDYLQLMGVADRYRGNRVQEVSELSTGLLKLARDLDIAVIALCQLNRSVESREDKRPGLSDLRESGSLEQDASVVMMLYRKAYYLQNKEPKPGTVEYEQWQTDMLDCWNKLDIIVEKNRNGSTGQVQAYVNPAVNAVRDLVETHQMGRNAA